ncbi:hypothetical protein [Pseudomonas sp. KBW05]|uniref:hypothetical protein n=1 Tax=Pseudomonas sp. KBW05 TaxID=2153360 RepID=UPI000F595C44|nr:hypothetical protein [Pseudomonas sp. KBW05]RQO62198.1 hypothetical protein DBR46_00470 [Pseudomonas sp. KBW05]
MSVRFYTSSAKSLLKAFDDRIKQKEKEGSITTWMKNKQDYYTHKSERWGGKCYFKARTDVSGKLIFNVIPPAGEIVTSEIYAFYHGHIIETFLNHFTSQFTVGEATAKPTNKDRLVSKTAKGK